MCSKECERASQFASIPLTYRDKTVLVVLKTHFLILTLPHEYSSTTQLDIIIASYVFHNNITMYDVGDELLEKIQSPSKCLGIGPQLRSQRDEMTIVPRRTRDTSFS